MTELSPEAKEARRKYIKEWRRKNPEKVKQYAANHWEHVAAREAEDAGNADDETEEARES